MGKADAREWWGNRTGKGRRKCQENQGKRTKEGGQEVRERHAVSKGMEIQGCWAYCSRDHEIVILEDKSIKFGVAKEPGQGGQGESDREGDTNGERCKEMDMLSRAYLYVAQTTTWRGWLSTIGLGGAWDEKLEEVTRAGAGGKGGAGKTARRLRDHGVRGKSRGE